MPITIIFIILSQLLFTHSLNSAVSSLSTRVDVTNSSRAFRSDHQAEKRELYLIVTGKTESSSQTLVRLIVDIDNSVIESHINSCVDEVLASNKSIKLTRFRRNAKFVFRINGNEVNFHSESGGSTGALGAAITYSASRVRKFDGKFGEQFLSSYNTVEPNNNIKMTCKYYLQLFIDNHT